MVHHSTHSVRSLVAKKFPSIQFSAQRRQVFLGLISETVESIPTGSIHKSRRTNAYSHTVL